MTKKNADARGAEPSPDDWESPPPSMRPAKRSTPPPAAGPEELPAGTIVGGRYEILGVLGKGGFGVVYDARHVELETPVALKLLHRKLTAEPSLFARFQREARSSAAIGHPNIVQVFDLGMDEHGAYIAMEKLEGEELADRIERAHPLPEALVARIGADVADAMAAAHERGVIHRDLKPQNVFLARVGRREDVTKVIDFGIAKLLHRVDGELTTTGQLFGTPRFMAPEQLRGAKNVDARVDVYAIGALLYRALTAQYPFDGETYPELVLQIMSDTPRPIARFRPDVTERMIAIVDKAMAKKPEDRFATAAELAEALHAHAEVAPTRAPSALPDPKAGAPLEESTGPVVGEPLASVIGSSAARRGRSVAIAAVAAVLIAVLGGVVLFGGGDEIAVAPPTPDAAPLAPPIVEPEVASPPTEEAPPPSGPVVVHVDSDPVGAHVRVAGALVCQAPCDATLAELPALLTAELEGYETTERFVRAPAPASVRIVLPRRRADAPPRVRRARPTPTDEPGDAPPPLLDR